MPDGPDEFVVEDFSDGGLSIDDEAESLLELEDELRSVPGAAVATDEQYDSGSVVGADRVMFDVCPETYPVDFDSVQLLRLDVELPSTQRTSVYLEWPDEITRESQLYTLLSAIDVPVSSFADILGESIPLRVEGSHYVVDIPYRSRSTQPAMARDAYETQTLSVDVTDTTNPNWIYVVAGTWIGWVLSFVIIGTVLETVLGGLTGLLLFFSWTLMPVGLYFDATYVGANSDWQPNKWLYSILSIFMVVNIPLGVIYLYKRHNATFDRSADTVRITDLLERLT